MKNKIKRLSVVICMFFPAFAFSQSNDKGTVHLGLGTWLTLGDASVKTEFDNLKTVKGGGLGVRFNFGITAQYGMSEKISAGVFIKRETAIYSTSYSYDDLYFTPPATDITSAGFSFGIEVKYYITNKNYYNLYVEPIVGYYSGDATMKVYDADGDLSGINYGLGGGINWYWGYNVGMSMDFALNGNSLSGSPDDPSDFDSFPERVTNYKVAGIGLYIGLGINIKFDRENKHSIL